MAWGRRWRSVAGRGLINRALPLVIAAWLSFIIAALLLLENAYWAAMPVWVISQPTRERVLGRAAYRIAGTLAGAGLGLAILHLPVSMTIKLLLAAFTIGLGAGLCHLLPGVRSYGALLLAVTTAVVVVPSVQQPDASVHLALERVYCTLIGVIVTTLVLAMWTPPTARQQFHDSLRRLAADAMALAGRVLEQAARYDGEERRILAEIGSLDARSPLVLGNSRDSRLWRRRVNTLMAATLEVLAAAYALAIQVRRGTAVPALLPDYLARASDSLRQGNPYPSRPELHRQGPLNAALERLLAGIDDVAQAERQLSAPAVREARDEIHLSIDIARDWRSAWQMTAIVGLTALLATHVVYLTGAATVVPMAMAVCIFSIVLGSLPLPQQNAPSLLAGVCGGVLAATAYRLWLQPWLDTPLPLVLSVLPFIVVGALARPSAYGAGGHRCQYVLHAGESGWPARGGGRDSPERESESAAGSGPGQWGLPAAATPASAASFPDRSCHSRRSWAIAIHTSTGDRQKRVASQNPSANPADALACCEHLLIMGRGSPAGLTGYFDRRRLKGRS